jgi:hypothetical protein
MAFMVWWLLWQWKAQSPSSSAKKSIWRIWPTATSVVTSYMRVDLRGWATVGSRHQKLVAMQMDWVVGHGQVAHADAHLVVFADHSAESMPGKTRLVPTPNVEVQSWS